MTAQEKREIMLKDEKLSFTYRRRLERGCSDNLINKYWVEMYPEVNNGHEAWMLISKGYDALNHTLHTLFDGEEYGMNFFDRLNEALITDFDALEKEGREFAKKRATEILKKYAQYDEEEVAEYAENLDPMGAKVKSEKYTFYNKLKTLKRWAEL